MSEASVLGATIIGVQAYPVLVTAESVPGLPGFDVTGIPSGRVRELKHRLRAALKSAGETVKGRVLLQFNARSIGSTSGLDLPAAVAVASLSSPGLRQHAGAGPEGCYFWGELSLSGDVRNAPGSVAVSALAKGALSGTWTGPNSAFLASRVPGSRVDYRASLRGILDAVAGGEQPASTIGGGAGQPQITHSVPPGLDQIKGQARAKRALEIAVAGGHNLLMVGPPGSAMTLMARAATELMPMPSAAEKLRISQTHDSGGLSISRLLDRRPFRAPHSTASYAAMIGGGTPMRPGECTLADGGVLFLDDYPQFRRSTLEGLILPCDQREIGFSRGAFSARMPADFMLIAAMNHCPCGWRGGDAKVCACTDDQHEAYLKRVRSNRLTSRFDLVVSMSGQDPKSVPSEDNIESSRTVARRIAAARGNQKARGYGLNSRLSPTALGLMAHLRPEDHKSFAASVQSLGLDAYRSDRVLRVARTIADLDGASQIGRPHLNEALTYRSL